MSSQSINRRFQIALIKPSHYDDDGYVIQWFRSFIPSNSLAAVYGLVDEARERRVLGDHIEIDIDAFDEINTRIRPQKIIERFRRHDNFGLVFLVGVQSNQFPRALDIARQLRAAGLPVAIGGFHVSGCLAMLGTMQADLQTALDLGITLYAGELEDRCDALLRDAATGALKPIYNYLKDLPGIESTPAPILPKRYLERTYKLMTSFDAGRGCPFECSFCTIINVQGRKSRKRSPEDVARLIRMNIAQGVSWFFITDDNFARNKDWENIFDRIIAVREDVKGTPHDLKIIIQVDTLCHKNPNFIAKAKLAGVRRVFIGLETINPGNLAAAKKRQNKITEYRQMLLAWKNAGIITYAGYILGFPDDTPESIAEDIAIIQKELPLDILEFFCLTPLPGSEDHKKLYERGVAMDADMNRYDIEHVVTAHPKMTRAQWEGIYREAWKLYYTPEHVERLLRRAAACGIGVSRLATMILGFSCAVEIENLHPLQSGILRLKYRTDRRPGLPIEPAWRFYPAFIAETVRKHVRLLLLWRRIDRLRRQIRKDPNRASYWDPALAPVEAADTETLALFTHNQGARSAVQHAKRIKELTAKASAAAP
ncbi:MAG TPA: radical SAM protein [Xanthobacteraceae bacterium]|nr:radical SAM protein [Xanthobacteraceae bacterium]